MDTDTLLILILVIIIALAISAFQYFYKEKERSFRIVLFSFLRFLTLTIIGLLIINPIITTNLTYLEKPELLIAFDNSKSITINEQDSIVRQVQKKFKQTKGLYDKYDVKFFSFGEQLIPEKELSFDEEQTNISASLYAIEAMQNDNNFQLVLVSDGNQTIGEAVDFYTADYTINAIGVGDTLSFNDLDISTINTNRVSYVGNEFPVEIFVNYLGDTMVKKRLNVYSGNVLRYSELLDFSGSDDVKIVSFYLSENDPGISYYSVVIAPLENERNVENNKRQFSLQIKDDSAEILILYYTVHPDLAALKNGIESLGNKKVHLENVNDFNGNLKDFELIILYQPNEFFDTTITDIQDNDINCFVVTGLSTDWSFLEKSFDYLEKENYQIAESYLPQFNLAFQSFSVDKELFTAYPPLEENFGELRISSDHEILLFQAIGSIMLDNPMLFFVEGGNRKTGFLLGENIFKWRIRDYVLNSSFENFDGFLGDLVQYLSTESGQDKLQLDYKYTFYSNEDIVLRANYIDGNFNFNPNAKLWLSVLDSSNIVIKKSPFVLENNHFNIELNDLSEGIYDFEVTVEEQPETISGRFEILPFEIEGQFSSSNFKTLQNIALQSGGSYYHSFDSERLINDLLEDSNFNTIQKRKVVRTPLIDFHWLLFMLLILLGMEWLSRKYFGKI